MSLVFEEEVHQFIQVILTFNSKGLGKKQNDLKLHIGSPPAAGIVGPSAPESERLGLLPSMSPVAATAQGRGLPHGDVQRMWVTRVRTIRQSGLRVTQAWGAQER